MRKFPKRLVRSRRPFLKNFLNFRDKILESFVALYEVVRGRPCAHLSEVSIAQRFCRQNNDWHVFSPGKRANFFCYGKAVFFGHSNIKYQKILFVSIGADNRVFSAVHFDDLKSRAHKKFSTNRDKKIIIVRQQYFALHVCSITSIFAVFMRDARIELALTAWEAVVLPLNESRLRFVKASARRSPLCFVRI